MRPLLTVALALLLLVSLPGAATLGEVTQQGGVRVALAGDFSPRALPRDRLAPVTVRIGGSIGTADGSPPPRLRRVSFAINRHGRISTRGLPTCPAGALQSTTTRVALARCRAALVGKGSFGAYLDVDDPPPVPVRGRLLAFNGRSGHGPALLVHLFVSSPTPVTLVLPFRIARAEGGEFGAALTARIPLLAGDIGYVTDINLNIGRRFNYAGRPRSLLSASCAAPPGFPGALFDFARGTFRFANGQTLSATLGRSCRVRR